MLVLGLSVLLSAPASAAGACHKAPPAAKPFGAKFIGEGPSSGEPCPVSGDTGDYREEVSRQAGESAFPTPKEPRPEPAVDQPPAPPALPPGRPVVLPPAAVAHAEPAGAEAGAARADARPAAAEAAARPVSVSHWSWPGPESPAARAKRAEARRSEEADDLRDAPAPVAPERFSLWAGLSRPLMLPASAAREADPAAAKSLGERDYAANILQQSVTAPPAPSLGAPSVKSAPQGRMSVRLEVDASDSPGEWKKAADELASAAGFEPDAEPARFVGPEKKALILSGSVETSRAPELLSVSRVKRLESAPAPGEAPLRGETRLLVGVRIPKDAVPSEVLREASARLADSASLRIDRAVAYQRIPGTDQTVVVVSGVLPVRRLAALFSDPAVAKVAPSPSEDASAPARRSLPPWRGVLRAALSERRPFFLAAVLACLGLWGPFARGRKPRRRA